MTIDTQNNQSSAVESVDERILAMAINRVGGAKYIFKSTDESQINGKENRLIYHACKTIFNKNKAAQILGMDLVIAELQTMGVQSSISQGKMGRINTAIFGQKDLNVAIDALKRRKTSYELNKAIDELKIEDTDTDKRRDLVQKIAQLSKAPSDSSRNKFLGMDEWMESINHIELLPDSVQTGFPILDEHLGGGLIQGGYHIISAPSSHGKTILMLSMWKNMLDNNIPAIYMNYEIARDLFMKFLFAQFTGINVMRRDNDPIDVENAKKQMMITVKDLLDRGLLLLSDPMQEAPKMWDGINDMLVDMSDELGAKVVFVDTINSIGAATKQGQTQRWNEYEEMAREAESICQTLNIALVMSAQMDQGSVKRDDKTPQLMDVAGSKTLTEKATSITHLHRSDLIDKTGRVDYSELYVTKNRVSGTEFGKKPIRIKYDISYKRLTELSREQQLTTVETLNPSDYEGTFVSARESAGLSKHPKLNIIEGVCL